MSTKAKKEANRIWRERLQASKRDARLKEDVPFTDAEHALRVALDFYDKCVDKAGEEKQYRKATISELESLLAEKAAK